MIISVPKCAVMCLKDPHVYTLNGVPIPVVNSFRDLGVTLTPDLDFGQHITRVVQSAHLVCNTLFRCFIVKKPDFYINLYRSLVLPKFSCCFEVWRPYLKKHVEAFEHVQNRLLKIVALHFKVPRDSLRPSLRYL